VTPRDAATMEAEAMTATKFGGFDWPRYTQIPNPVFDRFMLELSPSGFMVLMAITHQVMFHNRETGEAPVSQTELQRQTGLSERTVTKAVRECLESGAVIMVEPPEAKPPLAAMYTLRFKEGQRPFED